MLHVHGSKPYTLAIYAHTPSEESRCVFLYAPNISYMRIYSRWRAVSSKR